MFVRSDGQDLGGLAPSSITATLDGEPLTVGDFAESDEGIFYVFMLDISRSISQRYLDAAKQAVLNTYQQMRQQDQLAVITFGDAVTVLLDGSESAQVVSEKLAAVKATDSNTQFYAAMDYIELTRDYGIFEFPVPEKWDGKSIRHLNIREKYGINIIGSKVGEDIMRSPPPGYFSRWFGDRRRARSRRTRRGTAAAAPPPAARWA